MRTRDAAVTATVLLALYIFMPAMNVPIAWPSMDAIQQHVFEANGVYARGSYEQVLRFRWEELRYILPLHELMLARTLGLFLVGIVAWRRGVLRAPYRCRSLLLVLMILGVMVGALFNSTALARAASSWQAPVATMSCLSNAANIFLAMGYAALVIVLVEFTTARRILRAFAPLGRMAFTHYLVQSLAFSWIFFGYGLGYFGQWGAAQTLFFGVIFYACQMAFSAWWLRRYRFGPIEWLWRTLMHGTRQPMVVTAPINSIPSKEIRRRDSTDRADECGGNAEASPTSPPARSSSARSGAHHPSDRCRRR